MKRLFERGELLAAVIACVTLVGVSAYFAYRSSQPDAKQPPPGADQGPAVASSGTVEVGGIQRKLSDIQGPPDISAERRKPVGRDVLKLFGKVPSQEPDANPAVASAYEAIKQGEHPERTSPIFLPEEFVLAQYQADPEAYLNRHEPGRVFQSAQPGEGIPVLEPVSERRHVIKQGESVRLSVKTLPNMPVTFASFDIGTFDNGLATISVAANDQGVAETKFTGSRGKVGEVNILAASPVATERVDFNVFIIPPTPEER